MAWQSPNGLVHAMHSIRRTAQLRPFVQRSVISASFPVSSPSTPALLQQYKNARSYATELQPVAAPPIEFSKFQIQPARIIPVSPAYFSGSPKFFDHMLKLEALLAKYAALPTVSPSEAPRMAWFKLLQFRDAVGEPVPTKKYKGLIKLLQRLNRIDPKVAPEEVRTALNFFLRPGNPYGNKPAPRTVDEQGKARGKGKRKASSAVVQLVEGEGEVLVNGKTLNEAFPRLHDRESAVWPLRCTSRLDKYNVWATVRGGGVTGQAEAITLAVARALLVHEPALKPILRKGTYLRLPTNWLVVVERIADRFIFLQLVWLPWMPVVWRERSPVMSRPARCPLGSSGESTPAYLTPSFFFSPSVFLLIPPSLAFGGIVSLPVFCFPLFPFNFLGCIIPLGLVILDESISCIASISTWCHEDSFQDTTLHVLGDKHVTIGVEQLNRNYSVDHLCDGGVEHNWTR